MGPKSLRGRYINGVDGSSTVQRPGFVVERRRERKDTPQSIHLVSIGISMYVIDQLTASLDRPGLLYDLLITEVETYLVYGRGVGGPYMAIPDC